MDRRKFFSTLVGSSALVGTPRTASPEPKTLMAVGAIVSVKMTPEEVKALVGTPEFIDLLCRQVARS